MGDPEAWVRIGPGLTVRSPPPSHSGFAVRTRHFTGGLLVRWVYDVGGEPFPSDLDLAYVPSLHEASVKEFRNVAPDGAALLVMDISNYSKAVQLIQAVRPFQIIGIHSDLDGAKRLLAGYPKVVHDQNNESTCFLSLVRPVPPIVIPGPIALPCDSLAPPEAGAASPSASAALKTPPPVRSASAKTAPRHPPPAARKARSKCGCDVPGQKGAPTPSELITSLLLALGVWRRRQRGEVARHTLRP